MMVVLWIFAVVGFMSAVLFLVGLTVGSSPEVSQPQPAYQARPYHPQVRSVIDVPPVGETERAIQEHQTAVEQYRAMLDELYDYGERAARWREAGDERS